MRLQEYASNSFDTKFIRAQSLQEAWEIFVQFVAEFCTQTISTNGAPLLFLIWFLSRFESNKPRQSAARESAHALLEKLHFELHFRRWSSFCAKAQRLAMGSFCVQSAQPLLTNRCGLVFKRRTKSNVDFIYKNCAIISCVISSLREVKRIFIIVYKIRLMYPVPTETDQIGLHLHTQLHCDFDTLFFFREWRENHTHTHTSIPNWIVRWFMVCLLRWERGKWLPVGFYLTAHKICH